MARRPDKWMPIYWGDYLGATGHLSAAEHGAYLLLIGAAWMGAGALPGDDAQLARIARMTAKEWARSRATIAAFFTVTPDGWRHRRVDEELGKAQAEYDRQRARTAAATAARNDQRNVPRNDDRDVDVTESQPQPQPQRKEGSEQGARSPIGSRLPPDWEPGTTGWAFASDLGLDPGRVIPQFRDYWTAAAGAKARKADWPATWRSWCRREAEQRPRRGPNGAPPGQAMRDQIAGIMSLVTEKPADDRSPQSPIAGQALRSLPRPAAR